MAESRIELDRALARAAEQPDAGEVEALAEVLSWSSGEFTRWADGAHPDHNRWSWRGDGHGEPTASNPLRDHFRDVARAVLASDALAGVIREAQATAWDEGWRAGRGRGPRSSGALGRGDNPYRAARIDGGER